jgi:hypothetical protein
MALVYYDFDSLGRVAHLFIFYVDGQIGGLLD